MSDESSIPDKGEQGQEEVFRTFFSLQYPYLAYFLFYFLTSAFTFRYIVEFKLMGIFKVLRKKLEFGIFWIQIFSSLFFLYMVVAPLCVCFYWGFSMQQNPAFSPQLGWGISLVSSFVIFIYIALNNWYGHQWAVTPLTRACFYCSFVCSTAYCVVVIFLPEKFSYTGCTAIFFAINFLCISKILQTRSDAKLVNVNIFLQELLEEDLQDLPWHQKVEWSFYKTRESYQKRRIFYIVSYFVVLLTYAAILCFFQTDQIRFVGFLNIFFLMASDGVLITYKNKLKDKQIIQRTSFREIILLVIRIQLCFYEDYWFIVQGFLFYLVNVLFFVSLFTSMIAKDQIQDENDIESLYQLCPELQVRVAAELQCLRVEKLTAEVLGLQQQILFHKRKDKDQNQGCFRRCARKMQRSYYSQFLALFFLYAMFGLNAYVCSLDYYFFEAKKIRVNVKKKIRIDKITGGRGLEGDDEVPYPDDAAHPTDDVSQDQIRKTLYYEFDQWTAGVLSAFMIITTMILFVWAYSYIKNQFRMTKAQGVFVVFGTILILLIGLAFGEVQGEDYVLTYTSFAIIPLTLTTAISFFGIWKKNDYHLYQVYDSKAGDENQQEDVKSFMQMFFFNVRKFLVCEYRAKTHRDKLALIAILTNLGTLILYGILTGYYFQPWWVGYTISSWISIIEFTILAFVKYYQNYFQVTFMVQICCLLAALLYVSWCVIVGIFLAQQNEYKSDFITIVYVASVLGYMFFFSAIMSLMKYSTVKSIDKMPRGHKILFTLSASMIALYGAVIVRATKYYTVGILVFMGGLYLIAYFWWRKHYKLTTKLFAMIIILLSALKMVYFTSPNVKLESLSISLLTIFFFFLVFFLQKQSLNRERLGNQIFLYSKSVLPVLKYLPSQRQMRASNSEVIYFGLAMSSILVWTFMAGVLFDSQNRYLAISATALVLILSYIYLNSRIKKASYFQKSQLLRLNQFILDETIGEAVALKKIWREIGKQRKTILDCQLNILNGGDMEGGNLQYMGLLGKQMQKQQFKCVIQTHQEWKDYEKRSFQQLGGLFHFVCLLQPSLYKSTNDYGDPNLIKETKKDFYKLSTNKRFDKVWKVSLKSQQEQLYNIQFWAYFTASISMKASLLIEEEKSKIQTLIEAYKSQKEEEIKLQLEDGSFHNFLKEQKTREDFVQFIQEYYARHSDQIEQKVSELISQQNLNSHKGNLVQDDSLLKDMVYGSITESRLNETEQDKEEKLADKETESKTNEHQKDGFLFHLREPEALPDIQDGQSSGIQSLGVSSFNKTFTKSLAKSIQAQKDDTVQSSYHDPFKRKQLKIFSQKRKFQVIQKEEQKEFQDQLAANQVILKKKNEFQDIQRQKELLKQNKRKKQDMQNLSPLATRSLQKSQSSTSKREQSKLAQLLMKGRRSRLFQGTTIIKELASREESFDKQDCDRYERVLRNAGDNIYEDNEEVEVFEDKTFPKAVALGKDKEKYHWVRIQEMFGNQQLKVIEPLQLRETDIQQGQIGNCYFLSALSVIAHTKPHLIESIFHKKSRKLDEKGLYVMRFFKNRQPVIIHIDDYFALLPKTQKHAFCQMQPQNLIWPMLLEKGFAKLYGSYQNIDGGLVESAFADITNGAPDRFSLRDEEVKRMYNSGELWENLKLWVESGTYLLGAGTPRAVNTQVTEVSPIGIIQGHAYGILDVFEFEGNKLIQLRNPWGKQEWKGAWSKKSAQWTERRKRIVHERIRQKEDQFTNAKDSHLHKAWEDIQGIFWMSLNDFMSNFEDISICRFFDAQWVEVSYRGEWSTEKNQAGGCTNFDSVADNPQLSVQVYSLGSEAEVFAYLSIQQDINKAPKRMGIGFEFYQLGGKKITSRVLPKIAYANSGGYKMATEVSMDGTLKTQKEPYTLLISTFNPGEEASFIFTIWYKKNTGSVHLQELE